MLNSPHQNFVSRPSTCSISPHQSPVSDWPPDTWEQEGSVRIRKEPPHISARQLPYRLTPTTSFATQSARPLPVPVPRHSSYSGTTALQRSVSHMAAVLEQRTAQERHDISRVHHSHKVFVRGCELCTSRKPVRPIMNHQGQKRSVTMPPMYTSIPSSPVTSTSRANQDQAKTGHGTGREESGVSLSSPAVNGGQESRRSSYYVPSSALRTGAVVLGPRVRGGRHIRRGEGE
ncbi:hypothetical protein BCR39DRAFT_530467 [Naematelia encephala]|uniref:Uncharacterized protein n=1 Tax=Naematelia encephala TaxID=71784 RepID=A0A1Y2B582_9TREE|nr:hypothetical protein BCR39DRAFT_530467 [Naematelia encephala]